MTKPELIEKIKDQDRRIQELEEVVGKLEDMVINQAQDLHALQKRLEDKTDVWSDRSAYDLSSEEARERAKRQFDA